MATRTPGTLLLRDGDGNPVNVPLIILANGSEQPQSVPVNAEGLPFDRCHPLAVESVTLPWPIGSGGPDVSSASVERLLAALLAELRINTLLLHQALGATDDLDALRAEFIKQES